MDLRQACDRCHDKKLRCPRPPGSLCCSRCAKANVACVFSPPARPPRYHAMDRSDDGLVGLDWWPDLVALEQQQQQQQQEEEQQGRQTPSQAFETPPPQTVSQRLAAVLSGLDRMLQAMPSSLEIHHVPRQRLREYADSVGDNFHLRSTLDDLLHQAQDLASLYPTATSASLSTRATAPEHDAVCAVPDCIHQDRTSLGTTPLPKLDHAVLNLVMACHIRLLDVMDTLAEHGRMCAYMVATLPPDYDPKFSVPEIRVGSFVAPASTAASMLLSVLLELQHALVGRIKDMSATVARVREHPEAAREARVVSLQCEVLQERAEATLGELARFKDGLMGVSVQRLREHKNPSGYYHDPF
ncbi:transcription factor aceii [Trichoderma cornu-damae]|uniref:Transcription factor aceii n=1 Tax=Trichoderma cornu-damae TaxID=654480 RepID=A0A9P8TYF0_9HYPO|nr:transcription factor aceii [Trichoderma cornu-damae]